MNPFNVPLDVSPHIVARPCTACGHQFRRHARPVVPNGVTCVDIGCKCTYLPPPTPPCRTCTHRHTNWGFGHCNWVSCNCRIYVAQDTTANEELSRQSTAPSTEPMATDPHQDAAVRARYYGFASINDLLRHTHRS